MTGVNHTGSVLSHLSHRIGCRPAEFILVFDDLSLPIGTVRVRMKGSSGGHTGMGSIIETFQTEKLRRVKIGVGLPQGNSSVPEYVLTPFSASAQPVIDRACAVAADRILELVASFRAATPVVATLQRNTDQENLTGLTQPEP